MKKKGMFLTHKQFSDLIDENKIRVLKSINENKGYALIRLDNRYYKIRQKDIRLKGLTLYKYSKDRVLAEVL